MKNGDFEVKLLREIPIFAISGQNPPPGPEFPAPGPAPAPGPGNSRPGPRAPAPAPGPEISRPGAPGGPEIVNFGPEIVNFGPKIVILAPNRGHFEAILTPFWARFMLFDTEILLYK